MKDYLVTSDYGQYDNMWIVLAKDAKDAIQQVWERASKKKIKEMVGTIIELAKKMNYMRKALEVCITQTEKLLDYST